MNPKVDEFLDTAKKWQEEMKQLRSILLDCQLTEAFKWRAPCYLFQKTNIIIIGAFKNYCTLSFFKGALLKDTSILVPPGDNSQAVRMMKFTNVQEIVAMEALIKAYIYEAMEIEETGLKIDFKAKKELVLVDELLAKFEKNPALKTAFEGLTPGRRRAYHLHFSTAK